MSATDPRHRYKRSAWDSSRSVENRVQFRACPLILPSGQEGTPQGTGVSREGSHHATDAGSGLISRHFNRQNLHMNAKPGTFSAKVGLSKPTRAYELGVPATYGNPLILTASRGCG